MEYKVVKVSLVTLLNDHVNALIMEGWKPIGGHQVVDDYASYAYRGSQLVSVKQHVYYSQTMIKDE